MPTTHRDKIGYSNESERDISSEDHIAAHSSHREGGDSDEAFVKCKPKRAGGEAWHAGGTDPNEPTHVTTQFKNSGKRSGTDHIYESYTDGGKNIGNSSGKAAYGEHNNSLAVAGEDTKDWDSKEGDGRQFANNGEYGRYGSPGTDERRGGNFFSEEEKMGAYEENPGREYDTAGK
ncbi:hypothetical protein EJ08DRAFT_701991 [Tothia fuscella]|uniref:Uncharacterized protein n=1 Tax=Tothia fuscella TaxID=1048955 RepID=A0A9P4NHI6_9PEZI|nr:hypothetical protein EJ08DRAFT_701991 [Tothia fuscella]